MKIVTDTETTVEVAEYQLELEQDIIKAECSAHPFRGLGKMCLESVIETLPSQRELLEDIEAKACLELGQAAIKLYNRLSYLNHNELESSNRWLTAYQIAQQVDCQINSNLIKKLANKLQIEPTVIETQDIAETALYPPYALPLIKDELAWKREYKTADKYLTASDLSQLVGRSRGWTVKTLKQLHVRGSKQDRHLHPDSRVYNKKVLLNLREISLSTALDNAWFNIRQLSAQTKQDREWIVHRLEEAGVKPQIRRSSFNGHLYEHYPPESLDVINEAINNRPEFAGDWLTITSIATKIGTSIKWVSQQTEQFLSYGQLKQDDQGVNRMHYPPFVADIIINSYQERQALPSKEDFFTISDIYKTLGKSSLWVQNRIERYNLPCEMRRDLLGRPRPHYPPECLEFLQKLKTELESVPPVGDFVTMTTIAKSIGRTTYWTKKRLRELCAVGENRIDKNGVAREHFSPEIFDII